jgi:hypothetical protein
MNPQQPTSAKKSLKGEPEAMKFAHCAPIHTFSLKSNIRSQSFRFFEVKVLNPDRRFAWKIRRGMSK